LYQEIETNDGDEKQQQPQQGYTYKDAPQEEEVQDSSNNKDLLNTNGNVFPELVQEIRTKCKEWYALAHPECTTNDDIPSLNVCLLNFYEDGQQRIGWHSDREEIGRTTPIISVSLGTTRQFLIRSQTNGRTDRCSLTLSSGSLTMMTPECQLHYLHSVPKESNVSEGRINLTFRCKDKLKNNNNNSQDDNGADDNKQTTDGEELHERRDTFIDRITDGIKPTTKPWTASTTSNSDDGVGVDDEGDSPTSIKSSYIFGEEEEQNINNHNDNNNDVEEEEDGGTIRFVIKTNMGAERYCAAEIRERLQSDTYTSSGSRVHFINNSNGIPPNTKHNSIKDCNDEDDCYCYYKVETRPFELDGYISVVVVKYDDKDTDTDDSTNNKLSFHSVTVMVRDILLDLKTAHHVMRYHCHFRLRDCFKYVHKYLEKGMDPQQQQIIIDEMKEEKIPKETLYELVKEQLTNNTISFLPQEEQEKEESSSSTSSTTTTFRVTSDRVGGPHSFQTPEVEYEIGGAISEAYEHKGWIPKMTNYDICIRADIISNVCIIGTQCNIHDLSKGRHFMRFRNAVTIKTNLAYAMIRLANIQQGAKLLDPFCGSGTLLLEALEINKGQLSGCLGMDVSRRSANGARENAEAEGYSSDIVKFVCSDARSLRRHVDGDESVDAIVSNLPWGIMTGQNQSVSSLQTLYEVFLRNSWYVLKPGGRIVMLVLRGLQIMRIVRKLSGRFKLLHINVIRTTNNLPSLVVIEKLSTDIIRDSLKGQLAHLNQYVNVSPEIYQSIHNEDVDDDEPILKKERKGGGGGGGER